MNCDHAWDTKIEELLGKVVTKIERSDKKYEDCLTFYCEDGTVYDMFHEQDCCEHVTIEDVCGELEDLIGSPILMAEEVFQEAEAKDAWWEGSSTWTFYKFATVKGYVTIRWYGTSNGYYGETATIMRRSN